MVTIPVCIPEEVPLGVKVTPILHDPAAASGLSLMQLLVVANGPEGVTAVTLSGTNPPFVKITVCIMVLTAVAGPGWLPNVRLVCDKLTPAFPDAMVTVGERGNVGPIKSI
jgi:hypothetical protein